MVFRRLVLTSLCLLCFGLLATERPGQAQSPGPQPLTFFKNYFVTGDYVAAGVGLDGYGVNGLATRTIHLPDPDVPAEAGAAAPRGAEAVAAFLYWQVVVTSDDPEAGMVGVTFNEQPLYSDRVIDDLTGEVQGPLATIANPGGTAPCWSSGGGTGSSGGNKLTFTYRADVLRFLDVENYRQRISGDYVVQVPDSGNGNATPKALGASLVVVYRDQQDTTLRSVVLYDGSYTMDNATDSMTLDMGGFYDPLAGSAWKMTHMVGSAQANKTERLAIIDAATSTQIYEEWNPFQSADGTSWDTYTTTTPFSLTGDTVTTTVDHQGISSFDCITWGAVAVSGPVTDEDGDGLLNRWEVESDIVDPRGQLLPDLAGMGADPQRQDLFVEFGYMATAGDPNDPADDPTYGGVAKPDHTHLPSPDVIQALGDALASAPVSNPGGLDGIKLHVDVGDAYGTLYPGDPGYGYVIPVADGARGGESLDEMVTVCARAAGEPPWFCQFSEYRGTVGWKTGFQFLRDAWVDPATGAPVALSDEDLDACEATGKDSIGNPCRQRFDSVRKDMFRYVLFVHALGMPKADCIVDDPADPSYGFPDFDCMDPASPDYDPDFNVPVTNSGIGDFPGADGMVALGGFDDASGHPVGTEYMQAATLMHELGHQFWLRHGGLEVAYNGSTWQTVFDPVTGLPTPEPNCKPNYLSIMNYLFQLRGLRDDEGAPHVDFSRENFNPLAETNIGEPGGLGPTLPLYRTGWYAPQGPGVIGTPAARHCNGSPLLTDPVTGLPTEPPMVRVDSLTELATYNGLDWNWDGDIVDLGFDQDLNFDGRVEDLDTGYNDWAHIRLDQVGSRRNVGGWYWRFSQGTATEPAQWLAFLGPMSLDVGRGDIGRGDIGRGDIGRGDIGRGDIGRGDIGRGDIGRGDIGRGDFGSGDIVSTEDGAFELDADLAGDYGTPPTVFTAAVIGQISGGTDCTGIPADQCNRVLLTWSPPTAGTVDDYYIWRAPVPAGTTTVTNISQLYGLEQVVVIGAVSGQESYSYIDGREPTNGTWAYFSTATFLPDGESGESNIVIVEVVTEPPVAGDDSYSVDQDMTLTVAAPGVLGNDTDPDSSVLTAVKVSDPASGTLTFNADGSFTYTPDPSLYGVVTFTYKAVDLSGNESVATVTITVNRIVYGLVGVQNIPIPNKPQKAGSALPLKWQFTRNGVVVDSNRSRPVVQVFAEGGNPTRIPPDMPLFEVAEDSGSSSLRPGTIDNGWTWYFNWQLDNPYTHVKLAPGKYDVWILSRQSGQYFFTGTVTIR